MFVLHTILVILKTLTYILNHLASVKIIENILIYKCACYILTDKLYDYQNYADISDIYS